MALTNAELQAAYRARHLADEAGRGERLNAVIDQSAKRALDRLAACYGTTHRAILERLLREAESGALDRAEAIPDGPADYYAGRLRMDVDVLLRNEEGLPETAKKRAGKVQEHRAGPDHYPT
jgi:hypothetical protein